MRALYWMVAVFATVALGCSSTNGTSHVSDPGEQPGAGAASQDRGTSEIPRVPVANPPAQVTGEVTSLVADPGAIYEHTLVTDQGQHITLVGDVPPDLNGAITIDNPQMFQRGTAIEIEVDREENIRRGAGGPKVLIGSTLPMAPVNKEFRARPVKMAVILMAFSDFDNDWMTQEWALGRVFGGNIIDGPNEGGVKEFYDEMTHHRLSVVGSLHPSGDVFGKYTLPMSFFSPTPGQNCFSMGTAAVSAAKAAAIADGYVAADYDSTIVIAPQGHPYCGGIGGFATIGWTYINHAGWQTLAHEVGHTLGLGHANSRRCVNADGNYVTFPGPGVVCQNFEYGDPFDLMGGSGAYFASPAISYLGAFSPAEEKTVTESGTYPIYPHESDIQATKSLRIVATDGTLLSVEIRSRVGYDEIFEEGSPAVTGLSIRTGTNYPRIYDTDIKGDGPETPPDEYTGVAWHPWAYNAPLAVGRSVTWQAAGVRITHLAPKPYTTQSLSIAAPPRPAAYVKVELF